MTDTHSPPPAAPPPGGGRRRWPYLAAAILVALGALALVIVRDGDDSTTSVPAPSTSASTSTSVDPTTSTSTDVPAPVDDALMLFPDPSSAARFGDPVAVARAFATELAGFTDPVVGEYRAGDARSGEVDVRPAITGPITTVLVRQLVGDDWWVIGSGTAAVEVTEPAVLDTIRSPVRLRGRSTAFEANVEVVVLQDGSDVHIGRGWVMGGASGEMAPFEGSLELSTPSADAGAVILFTRSMENGHVWEAAVTRVRFADTSECGGLPAPPMPSVDEIAVHVFYTCADDDDGRPIALVRVVPETSGVLRAALDQLLAGPTAAERDAGFTSWFSEETRGMVASVNLSSAGHAVVDFDDLRPVIPNASASAGSQLLLDQLDATVLQFPTVRTVEYRIDGDCDAFFEWLQLAGCEPRRENT